MDDEVAEVSAQSPVVQDRLSSLKKELHREVLHGSP